VKDKNRETHFVVFNLQ